jgi:putative heme iron utilization protein
MSGVVRIEIRETTEELTTLMKKEKDVLRHEKLQVLYWLKTKTVDSVLSAAVRRTGNIVLQYKDGCLVIEKGE